MQTLSRESDRIESFKTFVEIVEKRYSPSNRKSDNNGWMYRGHSNSSYELRPSVGRLLGRERFPNKQDVLDAEMNSFKEFELKTYHSLRESNLFILLAIAQHHGLKTRLLDWTLSPFVALFFAIEAEDDPIVDGSLFAFRPKRFTTILRNTDNPLDLKQQADYQYLIIPSLSPRINAQKGVFQLFKDPTKPLENEPSLQKHIIPASCKSDIKKDLSNFGISYDTLFPDFDGIAKTINYIQLNERPW